jgi:hypothetical protein
LVLPFTYRFYRSNMSNRNTLENKRIRKAQREAKDLAQAGVPFRVFSDARTRERHRYRRDHGLDFSPVVGRMSI